MPQKFNFEGISVDEMWRIHEEISALLSVRLTTEKRELEKRLAQLGRESEIPKDELFGNATVRRRRKYPEVLPKYRNSKAPFETWSGRGKQPRWLTAALKSGHAIEEFGIG